jgi:hypothetical protein
MKKWIAMGILAILVIGMVLMSGCTNNASSSGSVSTPTPQIVYVTVLVTPTQTATPISTLTPTPTPTPTGIVGQDPIIGVWRCSDSSGYDHRYRFNADHTFVESFDMGGKTDVYKGTWRSQGSNSYVTVDTEFAYPETIVYSPSRNVIYSKDIPTFVLSPYTGDVKAASTPTKTPTKK